MDFNLIFCRCQQEGVLKLMKNYHFLSVSSRLGFFRKFLGSLKNDLS